MTTRLPVRSRWRRLTRWLLVALLVYGLGSFVGSSLLLAPPPRAAAMTDSGTSIPGDRRAAARLQQEWLQLDGDLRVPLWWGAPATEPGGCVLLFHGHGGVHPVDRMRFVLACGHAVVAPDFRAHGQAAGGSCGFGFLEQEEVRATLSWASRRWPGARVVAWGSSMGAAAILFAADRTSDLAGVILESTYSSLERAFRNRFEMHFPSFLFPLCEGPLLLAQLRSGLWLDEIQPIREIAKFRPERVLLVQGTEDERVQQDECSAFAAALPGLQVVRLEGLGHVDFLRSAERAYRSTIRDRLSQWLPR